MFGPDQFASFKTDGADFSWGLPKQNRIIVVNIRYLKILSAYSTL